MFSQLKILHLTHTDIRVDSRILKELSALEATGQYDLFAIGMAERGTDASVDILHNAKVRSLRIFLQTLRFLPGPMRHSLAYLEMALRVMVNGLVVRPQLIHCHDTPLLPVAVLLSWLCRAKVIYDAHELESDKNGQTPIMSKCTLLTEKICWRYIDGFVTVSNSIMRWYESSFARRESALVFNAPMFTRVDGKNSLPKIRYFHEKYDIAEADLVFVYLGLFEVGRGIEKLLKVFDTEGIVAHLVFVGRGSLSQMIQQTSLDNSRIHLHDAVPHDEVVELVNSADYGVCLIEKVSLSDYYSLPNKLFEYAFAGTPVLASDFPDMKALVRRFNLGICTANDEVSVAQAILRLQVSDRQRVCENLTSLGWTAQAANLNVLYQRVLHLFVD